MLQVASVLGRSFPRELLGRLVDAADDFDRSLWELQRRDLVLRDHIVPEEAYSFNHVLTQETIYAGIPSRRRRSRCG